MAKTINPKFYLGNILINGKQVSAFTTTSSIKKAAEIFKCSSKCITKNFRILEIYEAIKDSRFAISIDYPEALFVSNCTMSDEYKLFLDEDRFFTADKLITDVNKKYLFIKSVKKSKAKFLKVRLKDKIALANKMLVDLYLDLSKLNEEDIKTFFYIPFNEKLIDERWPHRAIETNHKIETLTNEMFDIYDEVITPYSAIEALDFIELG